MRKTPLLVLLSLTLGAGLTVLHAATTPGNGVLTAANPESNPLTYQSGPNTGVAQATYDNGAPCDAAINPCDEFELMVQLPEDYATTNPNDQILVRIEWPGVHNDYDLAVLDETGNELGSSIDFLSTMEEVRIPAQQGTRKLKLRANFATVANESYTGTVFILPGPKTARAAGPDAPRGDYAPPRFALYHSPEGRGIRAGEPTLFKNPKSPHTMFIAVLETLRVAFDDSTSPARDRWTLHSPPNGVTQSLDPLLDGDRTTGRIFNSQLTGANSAFAFSDNDGDTWTLGQLGTPNGGADHQSIAIGPYGPDTLPGLPTPLYPNALYYCSQSVAAALCARSDDGGLTFGPGLPAFYQTECTGLHGHVKVGPDGTVYIPNKNCLDAPGVGVLTNGYPGVIVSTDSGVTWDVRPVPTGGGDPGVDDPSVAIARDGTVYLGYIESGGRIKVARSRDRGLTWENDQDVGAQVGVEHIAFPAIVAGDPDRALVFFLGTTTAGNYADPAFEGIWHPYYAYTQDGGKTWVTQKVADDIVQRNGVCGGGACRNLLDFNDAVLDENGFVQLGYADGCLGSCEVSGPNSFQSQAVIARQSGGPSLYAKNDPAEPALPKTPRVEGYRAQSFAQLSWPATDHSGAEISVYNVYRSVPGGKAELLGATSASGGTFSYTDSSVADAPVYQYQVSAVNALGEGVLSAPLALKVGQNVPADASVCTLPGFTALRDPVTGDEADAPITTGTTDITEVLLAEPENSEDLGLTLRLRGFSAAEPLTQYTVRFGVEGGEHEFGNLYFVRLDNGSTSGEPVRSTYGYMDAVGALIEIGELPTAAEQLPGEIRFRIPKTLVGNPLPSTRISQVFANAALISNVAGQSTGLPGAASPYLRDRAGFGAYTLVGNDFCAKGAQLQPPTAVAPAKHIERSRFGGALNLALLLPLLMLCFGAGAVRGRRPGKFPRI